MLCRRCDGERHQMWLESPATAIRPVPSSHSEDADDNTDCEATVPMVPFYIENSEGIVVNEHLCYVYNRTDIIPHVELVNIVSQFYNDAQICAALTVLTFELTRFLPAASATSQTAKAYWQR